ncbi:MAG: hypothetical protein DLM72_19725 [Candidatus Nitrosopolaris wilkensis]|nr:MAG: hypothetical protein DLM72_19725 [Candidatus Nitrosopolaris wilkensis]
MQEGIETTDEEILSLFQHAIVELDRIEDESKIEKKKIVQRFAKSLERKIPTNTVAIEIVNQLRGRVSERFIRECLDQKYKQEHRVNNAKKQKQKRLAAEPPLKHDIDVERKEIVISTAGNTLNEEETRPPEAGINSESHLQIINRSHSDNSKIGEIGAQGDVVDFEFCIEWEALLNYLNQLRASGRTVEVWFNGELDRRTGKIIAAYTGTLAERN